jgi:7-keto-8-aminopelargonate synthetase-like enzyme
LSKSFGAYGGAILGSARLRQQILDRSRMFVGSTAPPPPLVNAALAGVRILKSDKSLRRRLVANAARVKSALRTAGLPLAEMPGPIVPLLPRSPREAARLHRALLAADIYPPFIKYPGGPPSGYFRFVISSEHSPAQLDGLIGVLRPFARR